MIREMGKKMDFLGIFFYYYLGKKLYLGLKLFIRYFNLYGI